MCRETSSQRGFVATILESDPQMRPLFRAFSPAEKIQKKTSAMTVVGSPGSRAFGAPRRVVAEDRHMNKSAPLDRVQSFAAKRAPSVQISSARQRATLPGAASTRTTLSRNCCCFRLELCLRRHEIALRQGCKCRCERPPAGCRVSPARHTAAFPTAHHRSQYSAIVVLQRRPGRSRQSSPPVHRQTKYWPASRLDGSNPFGALRVVLSRSACRCRGHGARAAGTAIP